MNILFIGNSLTFYHDLPEQLAAMRKARGEDLYVRQLTRSWHSLSRYLHTHTEPSDRLHFELANRKWDLVVLQDHGMGPCLAPMEFQEAVSRLDQMCRSVGAGTVLYETMACLDGRPRLKRAGVTAAELQEILNREYRAAAVRIGAQLAPVGEAFTRALNSWAGALHEKDGVHPSLAGTYLAAAVFECVLFGEREPGSYVPEGLAPADAAVLWQIARETVECA